MHEPQTESKYTFDELLGQCDPTGALTEEDRAWLDLPPAGREL
jgi:antitoxin ChpS